MFKIRESKPGKANLEYTTKSAGGWSACIKGKPTDANANVLSNCVGFASGRLNEIYNDVFKTTGCKYEKLNCNAEDFVERAKKYYPELKFADNPVPGAIICWAKGKSGSGSDGAGHVGVVERVIDNDTVYLSESNYGGTAFLNKTRTRGSNGRWGLGSAYTFRSFIYDPDVLATFLPVPVAKDEWSDQVEVVKDNLRVRVASSTSAVIINLCPMGYFNVLSTKESGGYIWYQVGEQAWIAGVEGSVVFHKAKEVEIPKPVERDASVNQVFIGDVSLRMRAEPNTTSKVQGLAEKESYYNVLEVEEKEDYTWYKLADFVYIAGVSGVVYYPFTESPEIQALKAEIEKLNAELAAAQALIDKQTKQLKSYKKQVQEANEKVENAGIMADNAINEMNSHVGEMTAILESIKALSK